MSKRSVGMKQTYTFFTWNGNQTKNDGGQVVSETSAIELADRSITHQSLKKRVLKTFEAVEKAREVCDV